jgi:hypothetical protein
MKTYGRSGGISQPSGLRSCRFIYGERAPGTHSIGGRMDPRAGLDAVRRRKIKFLGQGVEPESSSPISQLMNAAISV